MDVTIDRGNLGREVIRNWDKIHLNVNLLMHGNWVAYFRTWRRRSLFSGSAQASRDQSNVWSSQMLLHVIPKIETKIPRSVTFVFRICDAEFTMRSSEKRYFHHFIQEREEPANRRQTWRMFGASSVFLNALVRRDQKTDQVKICLTNGNKVATGKTSESGLTWKDKRANSRWSQSRDPQARISSRFW